MTALPYPFLARAAAPLLLALALCSPTSAQAWWNKEWTQRTKVTLDTSAKGVETKEALNGTLVAVRLHSGNFDFPGAKEDGSDLRVVAGDDKTPLKFSVERFDGINELALLWVQLPTLAAGSDKNMFHIYAGNPKAPPEAQADVFGPPLLATFHFSEADGPAADTRGALKTAAGVAREANGLLGSSARLAGTAFTVPASDAMKVAAGGATSVSLWVKPDDATQGTLLQWGALKLTLDGGKLAAQLGAMKLAGGEVTAGSWTQVALSAGGGKVVLYANGAAVAEAGGPLPELTGELSAGAGYSGLVDEMQIAAAARPADAWRVAAAAQGPDGKLLASVRETGDAAAESGHPGYFGVLVSNLTVDAWAVIIILLIMFAVAVWVMIGKSVFVSRADADNRRFLKRFRAASHDLLDLETGAAHPNSSLFRLYQAGVRELKKRNVGVPAAAAAAGAGAPAAQPLSGASIDAVKASIDADLVRESHQLNSQMVLLTIAISGGPFLGLLGTVVGVMITFAAIAAAGDVNVNAIAPGIAAALLATVAGLAVAIPALFGYNYLASRIKNISADMQIFVDEFVTRVAETYGAR